MTRVFFPGSGRLSALLFFLLEKKKNRRRQQPQQLEPLVESPGFTTTAVADWPGEDGPQHWFFAMFSAFPALAGVVGRGGRFGGNALQNCWPSWQSRVGDQQGWQQVRCWSGGWLSPVCGRERAEVLQARRLPAAEWPTVPDGCCCVQRNQQLSDRSADRGRRLSRMAWRSPARAGSVRSSRAVTLRLCRIVV